MPCPHRLAIDTFTPQELSEEIPPDRRAETRRALTGIRAMYHSGDPAGAAQRLQDIGRILGSYRFAYLSGLVAEEGAQRIIDTLVGNATALVRGHCADDYALERCLHGMGPFDQLLSFNNQFSAEAFRHRLGVLEQNNLLTSAEREGLEEGLSNSRDHLECALKGFALGYALVDSDRSSHKIGQERAPIQQMLVIARNMIAVFGSEDDYREYTAIARQFITCHPKDVSMRRGSSDHSWGWLAYLTGTADGFPDDKKIAHVLALEEACVTALPKGQLDWNREYHSLLCKAIDLTLLAGRTAEHDALLARYRGLETQLATPDCLNPSNGKTAPFDYDAIAGAHNLGLEGMLTEISRQAEERKEFYVWHSAQSILRKKDQGALPEGKEESPHPPSPQDPHKGSPAEEADEDELFFDPDSFDPPLVIEAAMKAEAAGAYEQAAGLHQLIGQTDKAIPLYLQAKTSESIGLAIFLMLQTKQDVDKAVAMQLDRGDYTMAWASLDDLTMEIDRDDPASAALSDQIARAGEETLRQTYRSLKDDLIGSLPTQERDGLENRPLKELQERTTYSTFDMYLKLHSRTLERIGTLTSDPAIKSIVKELADYRAYRDGAKQRTAASGSTPQTASPDRPARRKRDPRALRFLPEPPAAEPSCARAASSDPSNTDVWGDLLDEHDGIADMEELRARRRGEEPVKTPEEMIAEIEGDLAQRRYGHATRALWRLNCEHGWHRGPSGLKDTIHRLADTLTKTAIHASREAILSRTGLKERQHLETLPLAELLEQGGDRSRVMMRHLSNHIQSFTLSSQDPEVIEIGIQHARYEARARGDTTHYQRAHEMKLRAKRGEIDLAVSTLHEIIDGIKDPETRKSHTRTLAEILADNGRLDEAIAAVRTYTPDEHHLILAFLGRAKDFKLIAEHWKAANDPISYAHALAKIETPS